MLTLLLRTADTGNTPDVDEASPGPGHTAATEMIDAWRAAVIAAGPWAPRFRVAPGEVLLIDQYRMLHARDPFVGSRVMFRIHCWTSGRMYSTLPEVCMSSCGAPYLHPELMRGAKSPPCKHGVSGGAVNDWIRPAPLEWGEAEGGLEAWFASIAPRGSQPS